MTYSELNHAQTVLSENYNLDTDVDQIRTDFENAPDDFVCLDIYSMEDLEEVIKYMMCRKK